MKMLRLVITHTVDVEVDDRVIDKDFEFGIQKSFQDWNDGRMPFSVEMALTGLRQTAELCARVAQEAMVQRGFQKYPGAAQQHYKIEKLLPDIRVGYIQDAKVEVIVPVPEKD